MYVGDAERIPSFFPPWRCHTYLLSYHRFARRKFGAKISSWLPSSIEPTVDGSCGEAFVHLCSPCFTYSRDVFECSQLFFSGAVSRVCVFGFIEQCFLLFSSSFARATSSSAVIDRWENINMNRNDDVMSATISRRERRKKNTGKQPQDTRACRTAIMCDTREKSATRIVNLYNRMRAQCSHSCTTQKQERIMEILFAIICEPRVCLCVRVWQEKREGVAQTNESEKRVKNRK